MKIIELNSSNYMTIIGDYLSSKPFLDDSLRKIVLEIIEKVKLGGDNALIELTRNLDGVDLSEKGLRVPIEDIENARQMIPNSLRAALEMSAENIRLFHLQRVPESWSTTDEMGNMLGQKISPVSRVGAYAPGGKASYPSSVLMNCIPASIAGVGSIALCSPPGPSGEIATETLATAGVCGLDEIYRIGGAQAVAALAFGTETISRVDKITGPGNIYFTIAKKELSGLVGIDMLAGPSEIVVIADEGADLSFVVSDLLAQAEHGESSVSILITDSKSFAEKVLKQAGEGAKSLKRSSLILESLRRNGVIIVCESLDLCFKVSNLIAPEHLEVHTENPLLQLNLIENAGAIFLGGYSPVALGDYCAGPNHVLPTGTTARFSSGLGVNDFMKRSSVINYNEKGLKKVARAITTLAMTEGLEAHAASVDARIRGDGSKKGV